MEHVDIGERATASLRLTLPAAVIVTGTSSGLGLETARLLSNAGVHVIGVDVTDISDPDQLATSYRHVRGSVASPATWDLVEARLDEIPGNAGLGFVGAAAVLDTGTLLDDSLDSWRRAWEVNVLGNVLGIKRLLPRLMRNPALSAVVAVSSVDADYGEEELAAYSSSKAALSGALRSIALDFARTGIGFNILAPGPMRGGLFEKHLQSAANPAAFLATREARQPIGRVSGANEVAHAAAFLLSKEASAVFGTTLVADGGLTAGFDYRGGAELGR